MLSSIEFSIPPADLQLDAVVGEGGCGQVWKGRWNGKGGGITVAIKKVSLRGKTDKEREKIAGEVGIQLLNVINNLLLQLRYSI